MLVPTSFQPLTSEESVYMGVTVMGGVASQLAQAMVQMSHCKFLGFAHYTIAKPTQSPLFTNVFFFTNWSGLPKGLNKTNKYYSFLFGSTPLSEWIGVVFQYVATKESSTNSPIITFRVKNLSGTILSKAVQFTYSSHLNMTIEGDIDQAYTATTGATFYDPPSGTTGTDTPRPLYVPSANRGDMLLLEVEVEDCDLVSVSFFDLYQAEVTP
jgi:hypothetical protein